MAVDGKVRIQIDTNAGKATNELKGFDKAIKDTKKDGKELVDSNNMLQSSMNKLAGAAKGLVGGYFGFKLLSTLKDLGQQAIQTSAQFEQLSVSFRIMTGSAQAGKELTDSLVALASKTPMTTEALSDVTQTLLAFGESSNNIIQDLQLLGDITGGETQRFKSLALAFAQVGSTGRLTGQDLMQMVNQGFNPLQIMSEKTGKSMAQLKKEMADGKISFNDIKQAMIDATSEGGRFYGLMNEQSKTLNGLLSTNADTWQKVSKNIGDVFMPVAKGAVQALIALGDAILKLQQKMQAFSDGVNMRTSESLKQASEGYKKQATSLRTLADKEEARAIKMEKWNKIGAESIRQRVSQYRKEATEFEEASKRMQKRYEESLKNGAGKGTTTGGFGTGGTDGITPTITSAKSSKVAQVKEEKTAYDLLTESVRKYREEVFNAAITYGTSSEQVAQAMTRYKEANQQLNEIQDLFSDKVEKTDTKLKEGKKSYDSLSQSISSSLVSALTSGGNAFATFASLAVSALEKVIAKVLELAVITPILNSVTGGVGGSLFAGLFAKGGAFENGVQKFATGGVVNRPTTFPMAGGKTGLMGEAGAEAIMPLKRTSSGDLGIQATQPNINIYNQSGASIETVTRPDGDIDLFIKRVNNALSNERTQQGFSRALQRNDTRGLQAS